MPQTRQDKPTTDEVTKSAEILPNPIRSFACELAAGDYFSFHQHPYAQLVYASHGILKVTTHTTAYIVPPQRAVWVPSNTEHHIEAHDKVAMRSLYVEPPAINRLPIHPCVIMVSPLLRELILSAIALGNQYAANSPQSRIMAVIIDQITEQPLIDLALPLPQDQRLLQITQSLIKNPANNRTLEAWANVVGASKRTLNRLFIQQTSMSFQNWRQQLRLHQGIELLTSGHSVTHVALDLGYRNTSAFIAMFRRCLGTTPTEYLRTIGSIAST